MTQRAHSKLRRLEDVVQTSSGLPEKFGSCSPFRCYNTGVGTNHAHCSAQEVLLHQRGLGCDVLAWHEGAKQLLTESCAVSSLYHTQCS